MNDFTTAILNVFSNEINHFLYTECLTHPKRQFALSLKMPNVRFIGSA